MSNEKKTAMEDIYYRASWTKDEELLSKLYQSTVCRSWKKRGILLLVLGLVLLAVTISASTGIVTLRLSAVMTAVLYILDIFIVVIGIVMIRYHRIMARMAVKNIRNAHGGTIPETVYTFGYEIRIDEGELQSAYQYGEVTDFREEDDAFFVMFGKYSAIMLPKKSFDKGDPEEFAGWIRQKAPRLRNA